MEILKVENLCKQYGKGENKVTALDNVSFTVNKGEFVAIVGASGRHKHNSWSKREWKINTITFNRRS